jgi:hypothetical protein
MARPQCDTLPLVCFVAFFKYMGRHFPKGVSSCEVSRTRGEPQSHSPTMTWLRHKNASPALALLTDHDMTQQENASPCCVKIFLPFLKNFYLLLTVSYHIMKNYLLSFWSDLGSHMIHEITPYNHIENDKAFQLKNP